MVAVLASGAAMAEEGSDDAQAAQADLVMPNVSRPAARTHPRRMDDGDTTRTILSPTAFVRARGELTLNRSSWERTSSTMASRRESR
jgi:hypothetical protein